MEEGEIVAGVVSDPLKKETYHAVRGLGAFLNDRRISVSKATTLNRSIIGTGFPYDKAFTSDNNLTEFSRVLPKVQGMRRLGSAALDLAYVACGRLDGFWELKLKPWDIAAGILIVEEAGGSVTDRFGDGMDLGSPSILATNGLIHTDMIRTLNMPEPL
jgi:myo-inositol-1(or 4)-monophosphatase